MIHENIEELLPPNNSLKPTITRVTHFAEKAKCAPHYGGLIPPLYGNKTVITQWNMTRIK